VIESSAADCSSPTRRGGGQSLAIRDRTPDLSFPALTGGLGTLEALWVNQALIYSLKIQLKFIREKFPSRPTN
jgi:hypothetical protein